MKITAIVGLAAFTLSAGALADDSGPSDAERQFAQIAGWEGRWTVSEADALEIVFEQTARGTTMIERWETAAGLHSMTVYHLDGDAIVATHYCPQGNQPRLESVSGEDGRIAFSFRDVTGLDEGESHTHSLAFSPLPDGSLQRTEVYRSAEGLGEPSSYTLSRAEEGAAVP